MSITKKKIKMTIKKIIKKKLRLSVNPDHLEEDNIMDKYGITSLAAYELLIILEKKFKLLLAENDITIENFDSITKMSDIIFNKLSEK